MLVLSRRNTETIVFPELGITVEVLQVKGNTVRLGIKAPDDVRILRGELADIRKEFEPSNYQFQVACDGGDIEKASWVGTGQPVL